MDVNVTPMSDESAIEALVNQMKVEPKAPAAKSGVRPPSADDDADLDDEDIDAEDEEEGEADEGEGDDPDADEGEDDEEDDEDDEGDDEEEDEPEAPPAAAAAADEAIVKVTVNGEETEVTVGSLKRLAGQEATLTRKSQEADVVGGRAALMIQGAIEGILEDLEPYKDIDWTLAAVEMEPDEFKWHRENFTRNEARYNKLLKEASSFEQIVADRQAASVKAQAAEALVELTADVPGWNDEMDSKVRKYAAAQGLDEADVASIANAKVLKLLRKAMLHDEAATAVAKKVNLTPKRVKRSQGSEPLAGAKDKQQRILEKKMASGLATDDDAIALLVGRWKK